jgi:hypothetical protein
VAAVHLRVTLPVVISSGDWSWPVDNALLGGGDCRGPRSGAVGGAQRSQQLSYWLAPLECAAEAVFPCLHDRDT